MNIEEAIKVLNNFNPVDCGREDTQAIETLLTAYEKEKEKKEELIKERAKEIEELKKYEEGYKLLSYSLDNYISKDKIKAKIEPVLKQLDTKMKEEYNKYGNSREYQDIIDAYNFLQSLLEKE